MNVPGRLAEPPGQVRAWSGRIFLDAGAILFLGPGGCAEKHAHHAVQLVWALEGDLSVTFDESIRRRATLIPADVTHAFDATGRRLAILFIEPHGGRGAALDRRARAHLGAEVGVDLEEVGFPRFDLTSGEAARWCDAALGALGSRDQATALSVISRRTIAYIEETIAGRPQLEEAARRAGVSSSRLTHVFSAEVGIPFRRFVLWTRLKHAVAATRLGDNLTQAAVAAGFADCAHLSRTFRAMFGMSPSVVLPLAAIEGSLWGTVAARG